MQPQVRLDVGNRISNSRPSPIGQETVSEPSKPSKTRSHSSDSLTSSTVSQTQPGEHLSEVNQLLNAQSRLRHQENAENLSKSLTAPLLFPALSSHAPSPLIASMDRPRPLDYLLTPPPSPLLAKNAPDSPKAPRKSPQVPASPSLFPTLRAQSEAVQGTLNFMFGPVAQPAHPGYST
ncbi:hypothetical protein BD779DRAFT_818680 [Infundibulicybe gibba]|nr:hypothetical protein BD779DRAFT_818680 [Infundibulicybe gibba]